jgi:hypothetical protein
MKNIKCLHYKKLNTALINVNHTILILEFSNLRFNFQLYIKTFKI